MRKFAILTIAASLGLAQTLFTLEAKAVGPAYPFNVQEGNVPGAMAHAFQANSLDLTYHACVIFPVAGQFIENGYFWISSYQNRNSVIDSQINAYFGAGMVAGYRIYGIYEYQAQQVGVRQMTPTGKRLNYVVNPEGAQLSLFLDINQDTVIGGPCPTIVAGNNDDVFLGIANAVVQGEKSETDGLANGDFKLVFTNWNWNPLAWQNPIYSATGFDFDYLIFNGNVTQLQGPLGNDHNPEGSGNLFWRKVFNPLPWNQMN